MIFSDRAVAAARMAAADRAKRVRALAERAAQTFPPKLEPRPQEGPVETPEGDRALERRERPLADSVWTHGPAAVAPSWVHSRGGRKNLHSKGLCGGPFCIQPHNLGRVREF